MKVESQYSKAKKDSMIYAFSISIIICIPLSYVSIDVWWGKLMFEMATKTTLLLLSWKVIYEWLLNRKEKSWEKNNKNLVLRGLWHVVHYSDDEKYKSYLRLGTVILEQTMDKYFFKEGRNSSPNVEYNKHKGKSFLVERNDDRPATWGSFGNYIYSKRHGQLSGTFDVFRDAGETDGMHIITVKDCENMNGLFFNVNSIEPNKPKRGTIYLFKDKEIAKNFYIELYNKKNERVTHE